MRKVVAWWLGRTASFATQVEALWRRKQRAIDVDILWPVVKEQCANRAAAEAVFLVHMGMDSAYAGMDEGEVQAFLRALP